MKVSQEINGETYNHELKNVAYAPDSRTNLISGCKAQESGISILFLPGTKMIAKYNGKIVLQGNNINHGIYELYGMKCSINERDSKAFFNGGNDNKEYLVHRRLGHTSTSTIAEMKKSNCVIGLENLSKINSQITCSHCCDGKMSNKPHKRKDKERKEILDLVYTDLSGKINPKAYNGDLYCQLLLDDASGAIWFTSFRSKSEAKQGTKKLIVHAQSTSNQTVKNIRSDGGSEFLSRNLLDFHDENNIHHQIVPPYSPEANGNIERCNRTVVEMARTLISELRSNSLLENCEKLWTEALRCAVYISNRVITKRSHARFGPKTPHEIITGRKPNISN